MFYLSPTLFSIIEVLLVILPVLIGVAFVTVAERKTMASMQRRLGPNIIGYYGLLQALKEEANELFHKLCALYVMIGVYYFHRLVKNGISLGNSKLICSYSTN